MYPDKHKCLTKAIWIIYIILSQEQTLHVPPIRFGTLMQFKLIFQMMIQSNGQSGDDTSSVKDALIGRGHNHQAATSWATI